MAELGTISVALRADAGQFTAGMKAATAATEGLTQAASATSGPIQRLGQGFERLESREGYTVLRQTSLALEQMTLTSIGAEGPLGRVGAGLALIGGGTGVGLAAMAAIAALGEEFQHFNSTLNDVLPSVKAISSELDKARQHTDEFQNALQAGAKAEGWKQLQDLQDQLQKVDDQITKLQSLTPQALAFAGGPAAIERLTGKFTDLNEAIKITLETLQGIGTTVSVTGPLNFSELADKLNFQDFMSGVGPGKPKSFEEFMRETVGERGRFGFQSLGATNRFGGLFAPAGPTGFQLPQAGSIGFNGRGGAPPGGFGQLPSWDTSMFQGAPDIIPDAAKKVSDPFAKTLGDEMFKVGASVSKRLADGLISGKMDMGKIGQEIAQEIMGGLIDSAFQIAKTSFIQSLTREAATAAKVGGFVF